MMFRRTWLTNPDPAQRSKPVMTSPMIRGLLACFIQGRRQGFTHFRVRRIIFSRLGFCRGAGADCC